MWRWIAKGLLVLTGLAGGGLVAASCGSSPGVDSYDNNEIKEPPPPPPDCTADDLSTCEGPPDKRCGVATCIDGVCGVAISPGPIASQIAGDCKRSVCNADGVVVEEMDPADFYDDGLECTFDYCKDGNAIGADIEAISCPETGVGYCKAGVCAECISFLQCSSKHYCVDDQCVPDTCANSQLDGDESDVYCGGSCLPCLAGKNCKNHADCESKVCVGNKCQAPSCEDSKKNAEETDVDCGTSCPGKLCADGKGCATGADCQSHVCWAGQCQKPSCTDGVQNASETGIDCGGSICSEC